MTTILTKKDTIGTTMRSGGAEASSVASCSNDEKKPETLSSKWTALVNHLRVPILKALQTITRLSAQNPKRTIASVILFSFGIFAIGLVTNFGVTVDEDSLWTPKGGNPAKDLKWLDDKSGFPVTPRSFLMVFHQDGDTDILGRKQVTRIFEAFDSVRKLPGYDKVCSRAETGDCSVSGVVKFWNSSSSLFESSVSSDEDAIKGMSASAYPDDGTPVYDNDVWGNAVRDKQSGLLVSAQFYLVIIDFPDDKDGPSLSEDFERDALDTILDLKAKWEAEEGNRFRVEVIADRSFPDEFQRAIVNDIPLVPLVFVLMGITTSALYFKKDRIQSRSLLGFTSVISVLLSILAGYGLLFVCAVPFTSMTQILPFVFFGVGLDDAFIITGCFFRMDPKRDIIDRLHETIDEIGLSIFLTTLTSALAFGLSCTSSVPAIKYLCLYAVPTVIFILLFQLTFFIACLVLDERRIEGGNRDCFRCLSSGEYVEPKQNEESRVDRFMGWYAEKLLKPAVKVAVILVFVGIAVAGGVSASQLKQAFKFTDVLPSGSYITDWFNAFNDYSERSSVLSSAYFRYVDQSDPLIQDQMEAYINDLVTINAIKFQPNRFWLRDFKTFVAGNASMAQSDFVVQLDSFLSDPVSNELYKDHIVRSATTGEIITSRCVIPMDNVDLEDIEQQIKALKDQRAITQSQDINEGHEDDLRFFLFGDNFPIWAFYEVSAKEIMSNTILSIAAVVAVALFLIPHWTAALFTLPLMAVLYVDLLGVLQWANVSINPVSYISLVMSIGLMVDFIIHVLLRYYEAPGNRHEKTVDMLKTMGSSILIGGITTFLGTLPLAFSSSSIFQTVFICFLGLVCLGITHGLVVLPVFLSMIGPEEQIAISTKPLVEVEQKVIEVDGENRGMTSINLDDIDSEATA